MPIGWETPKEELSSQTDPKKKTTFIPIHRSVSNSKMKH